MVPRYTARLILRTDKRPHSETKAINLKCHINGKKVVLSTGIMCHVLNWVPDLMQLKYHRKAPPNRLQVDDTNLQLAAILNKANELFMQYRLTSEVLDVETFKRAFTSGAAGLSFHAFFDKELATQSNVIAPATLKQYLTCQRLLQEFEPNLPLHALTPNLVKRYDGFLRTKGYNNNSRMKHHRMAKHYMLLASKQYLLPNPYDGFKIQHITGHREYLNKYEVAAMVNLLKSKCLDNGTLRAVKKYLFCCHCGGLRISDIHNVGIDDVYDNVLVFVPQKTSYQTKRVQVPLPKNWQQWVEHTTGPHFFTAQADQYINRCLKKVAAMLNIKKQITFHTARHTFATGFLNAGGKVEVLQRILGHADIKTTMVYVHISRQRLTEEMENIDLYK